MMRYRLLAAARTEYLQAVRWYRDEVGDRTLAGDFIDRFRQRLDRVCELDLDRRVQWPGEPRAEPRLEGRGLLEEECWVGAARRAPSCLRDAAHIPRRCRKYSFIMRVYRRHLVSRARAHLGLPDGTPCSFGGSELTGGYEGRMLVGHPWTSTQT